MRHFALLQLTEMALLSNSRWQNRTERPNRLKNNVDMAETANRFL